MSKSKVQCPRCFSENLYKYSFDKYGNQKYQCIKYKRQFASETLEFTKPKQISFLS
jgi:transposase-like protein